MRSISSSMIHSVRMARLSTEVKATSGASFSCSSSRPACAASARPCSERSTSVQPVNRFSTFQMLWPWRTRISLPGGVAPAVAVVSVGKLFHRFQADRERREVTGASRAHIVERSLPVPELLAGGGHPGVDPGAGVAAHLPRQYPLGEPAVHAQRAVTQTGARDSLPRTVDGKLLDAPSEPVDPDAR